MENGEVADVGETLVRVGGGMVGFESLELTPESLSGIEAELPRKK